MSAGAGNRGEVEAQEPSAAQRTIARRAAESRATIPHLEMSAEVEVDALLGRPYPPIAALVKATALALREHPVVNGAYRDGRFERYSRVNVGVVVSAGEAFALPTLFDADRSSPEELGEELGRLAARARAGELAAPELSGATFSVAFLGAFGVTAVSPVIVPGHAAALGAGAIREVPVVRDGTIAAGHVITITLACDHRILYAQRAGAFLAAIARRLERGRLA